LFSNVSIIPNFVSVMSKTVKPSWSFPAVSANVADTAHTTIGSLFLFYG